MSFDKGAAERRTLNVERRTPLNAER
jgi:hypothetical protein